MGVKALCKAIAYWTIPPGFQNLLRKVTQGHLEKYSANALTLKLCARNTKYKDIHKGKRCFIVCNGPSINKQDLLPLKNEIVFSVSSGYLHKDYLAIQPRYHVLVPLIYGPSLTEAIAIDWFKQMHDRLGSAEIFMAAQDEPLTRQHDLFPGRTVHYIYANRSFEPGETQTIDISKGVPGYQSSPIMSLMIAMYMGINKIYLLGTEHDSFASGIYKHFYTNSPDYKNKDMEVTDEGKIISTYEELKANLALWEQYRVLKNIARHNNIEIYNATAGGRLDEFERVALPDIVR